MPQLCTDCRTANRDGAKFCMGCGRRLGVAEATRVPVRADRDDDWPATQRLAQDEELAIPIPARPTARATAAKLAPAWTPRKPSLAPRPVPGPSRVASAPKVRRELRANTFRNLSIALLVIVIAAAIAGWRLSGDESNVPAIPIQAAPPPPALPAAPPVAAKPVTEPVTGTPPLAEPTPPTEPPASAAESEPSETAAPEPPPATAAQAPALATPPAASASVPLSLPGPAKPVVNTRKARKPTAPAPAPAVAALPQAASEPAPAPAPVEPPAPLALCGDLNFFSRARCMADQCAKPEYKSHAQCEAVRRQQQIDEEKRNPSLNR
jgi:hypothetical protein